MPSYSVCTRLERYLTRVLWWLKPPAPYHVATANPEPRIDSLSMLRLSKTLTVPSGHSRPGVPCRPGLLFSSLVGLILDCVVSDPVPTMFLYDPWPGPVVPDGPAVPVSYTDGRPGATAPSPLFRVIRVM